MSKSEFMDASILLRKVLFVGIILVASCKNHKCDSLPEYFSSEEDGLSKIKSTKFKMMDSIDNPSGSWLMAAHYYSCDGKIGYLVYRLKGISENYNPEVPIGIWNEFKSSSNKETFYNERISQKYLRKVQLSR